jgi:hypothetical protein
VDGLDGSVRDAEEPSEEGGQIQEIVQQLMPTQKIDLRISGSESDGMFIAQRHIAV